MLKLRYPKIDRLCSCCLMNPREHSSTIENFTLNMHRHYITRSSFSSDSSYEDSGCDNAKSENFDVFHMIIQGLRETFLFSEPILHNESNFYSTAG